MMATPLLDFLYGCLLQLTRKRAGSQAEQLQESYVEGRRLWQRGNPIRLELVCGLDWDPRHDSEQIPEKDLAEKESLSFSDGHRPLISIQLDPQAGAMPGELRRLAPCLIKFVQAAATGTTD